MPSETPPASDAEFLKRQAARCAKRGEYKTSRRIWKIAKKLTENEKESK